MDFDCYAYGNIKVSKITPIGDSSSEGHSEIQGLRELQKKGLLKEQDVIISDVKGHYQKKGSKVETDYPDPVCAECRANIFDILINGEAKSVTLPKTVGGKNLGQITIQSKDFSKVQKAVQDILDKFEEIKINQGKKLNGNQLKQRSNKIWEILENPHKIK